MHAPANGPRVRSHPFLVAVPIITSRSIAEPIENNSHQSKTIPSCSRIRPEPTALCSSRASPWPQSDRYPAPPSPRWGESIPTMIRGMDRPDVGDGASGCRRQCLDRKGSTARPWIRLAIHVIGASDRSLRWATSHLWRRVAEEELSLRHRWILLNQFIPST